MSPFSRVSDNFFVSRIFLSDLLEMVSFDKSDSFNDEYDNDRSDSGSNGTCDFTFYFDEPVGPVGDSSGCVEYSVGRVSSVGSGVFVLAGIYSIGGVVPLFIFVPKGVKSKGGLLIETFSAQNPGFPS